MKIIYKYPLQVGSNQIIRLPTEAKILSVQAQNDKICLWVLVEPENPTTNHVFHVVGTGRPLPFEFSAEFIGTVQVLGGALIWHVFKGDDK